MVRYDDLPILPASGLRHSWQVFGDGDQLGTLNRVTAATVAAAATQVRTGERIALSLPLDVPDPPLFTRQAYVHPVYELARNAWDDRLDNFHLQASSQWDGFRHVRAREDGHYGGWTAPADSDPQRLGIGHWAAGIVGRGVLVDVAGFLGAGYDPATATALDVQTLRQALDRQGVAVGPGDILCLDTGWLRHYRTLDRPARERLAGQGPAAGGWAGLSAAEDTARWLWDSGIAAVVADNPSVEVAPGDPALGSLHRRLIPALGFALGELFDLDPLTERCRADGRWDFLFVGVPLNLPGGVGSPANAIAIR
jgi:kynurenine formamidase